MPTSNTTPAGEPPGGWEINFEDAARRIRELTERILDSAKQTGGESLDAYEKALESLVDFEQKAGMSGEPRTARRTAAAQTSGPAESLGVETPFGSPATRRFLRGSPVNHVADQPATAAADRPGRLRHRRSGRSTVSLTCARVWDTPTR
jgi:hypothetical protein